jgi:hypothetical protein
VQASHLANQAEAAAQSLVDSVAAEQRAEPSADAAVSIVVKVASCLNY